MPFDVWRRRIDRLLLAGYVIDFNQAGDDEEQLRGYWQSFPDPEEFVEWYATKYDLIHISEWGLGRGYPLKTFSR
jgi:hypothetical protein